MGDKREVISYEEKLDDETIAKYSETINNAINHYIRLGVPASKRDDFFQECFLKIVEYAAKEGYYPEQGMAYKISKNRIADLIDYNQRRNTIPISVDEEGDRASWNIYEDDPTDEINYNDLINMFPEGSRERKYLQFFRDRFPNLSKEDGPEILNYRSDKKYKKDPYEVEDNLAKALGFPSVSASAYRSFRDKMWKIIKAYYGK